MDANLSLLVLLVKKKSFLWDANDSSYGKDPKTGQAWQEIGDEIGMDPKIAANKWNSLVWNFWKSFDFKTNSSSNVTEPFKQLNFLTCANSRPKKCIPDIVSVFCFFFFCNFNLFS